MKIVEREFRTTLSRRIGCKSGERSAQKLIHRANAGRFPPTKKRRRSKVGGLGCARVARMLTHKTLIRRHRGRLSTRPRKRACCVKRIARAGFAWDRCRLAKNARCLFVRMPRAKKRHPLDMKKSRAIGARRTRWRQSPKLFDCASVLARFAECLRSQKTLPRRPCRKGGQTRKSFLHVARFSVRRIRAQNFHELLDGLRAIPALQPYVGPQNAIRNARTTSRAVDRAIGFAKCEVEIGASHGAFCKSTVQFRIDALHVAGKRRGLIALIGLCERANAPSRNVVSHFFGHVVEITRKQRDNFRGARAHLCQARRKISPGRALTIACGQPLKFLHGFGPLTVANPRRDARPPGARTTILGV